MLRVWSWGLRTELVLEARTTHTCSFRRALISGLQGQAPETLSYWPCNDPGEEQTTPGAAPTPSFAEVQGLQL